jgi:2-polyprenyl-6-hydroxyphenyl methylase/3-demethylubiquinone-9 3-methyltransferase
MNVDTEEIKKFDALAPDWWDTEGPFKPLHDLNPVRLAFIQSYCSLSNQSILDVGCGGGILTETLSHFSPHVVGIDQAPQVLAVAKKHAESLSSPPCYECVAVEDFAAQYPQRFDVITCMELLEHVPDPVLAIGALSQLLKPQGHLFISTINRTPMAFLQAIVGAEYILRILPRGTHDYSRFIRPSEMTQWAQFHNLKAKHIKGFGYRLLNKTFYISEDVSVNYIIHFEKE